MTGPDYARIGDHELVAAVMRIAGDGVGDTRWKVPGVLDWSTMTHNPFVEVTKDTTTLRARDRDVSLFLVDDTHPIEAGRLQNGDPDLYRRGFYCWNSEVGSQTLGMASFNLRAVCMNRIICGAKGFEEILIRHSKFAASRFPHEVGREIAGRRSSGGPSTETVFHQQRLDLACAGASRLRADLGELDHDPHSALRAVTRRRRAALR